MVLGQYYDLESGLFYNPNRDNPQREVRIERPIGIAGGLNTFNYARQNPLMRIYLWGLAEFPPNFYGPVGRPGSNVGTRRPDGFITGRPVDTSTIKVRPAR